MAVERGRKKMTFDGYPRHILLRVRPDLFHRLHERAARNNKSLNFDLTELIQATLDSETAKAASPTA